MDKILKYVKNIATFAIILLAFLGGCSLCDKLSDKDPSAGKVILFSAIKTTSIDTVYVNITDTIYNTSPTLIVEKIVHDTIIRDNLFTMSDTIGVVKEFFTKRFYKDTLVVGKYGYVVVEDSIYNNKIENRKFYYSLDIPEVTVTDSIVKTLENEPRRFRSFAFSDISVSNSDIWDRPLRAGVGIQYAIIKNHYFGVSGDLLNRDIIATYDFNTKKVDLGAAYSINNQYLNLSAKYWITK